MITWTQLYLQTHQFNEGAIPIASSFVGNVLAIAATTKPEYAESKQIIGYVFQDSGEARKGYALYSGKDILLLALPETSGLTFFPTNYLSDSYTLDISYASVGNILESNTAPIPDLILGLPVRVSEVEASVEGLGLAVESQTETDLSHASRLAALEGTISNPSWSDISDKPTSFTPSSHNHSIGEVTGLGTELTTLTGDLSALTERVDDLEADAGSGASGSTTTPLSTDTVLEGNKRYLSTVANLIHLLPSSPSIGDLISVATGNFNTRVNHGNASQQVLNSGSLTIAGLDNGVILKPYSRIDLMYLGSDLWVSQIRVRTVNNWKASGTNLTFASLGDTNGFFNYLGTNRGIATWQNPITRGLVFGIQSTTQSGSPSNGIDRNASTRVNTNAVANDYVGYSFASTDALKVSSYTLQSRSDANGWHLKNWVLEGSNNVADNTLAGFNAATWTAIDTRTNDSWATNTSVTARFVCNGDASTHYKAVRIRTTGVDSSGTASITFAEIELYGQMADNETNVA